MLGCTITIMIFVILMFIVSLRIMFIVWTIFLEVFACKISLVEANQLSVKSEFDEARDMEGDSNG